MKHIYITLLFSFLMLLSCSKEDVSMGKDVLNIKVEKSKIDGNNTRAVINDLYFNPDDAISVWLFNENDNNFISYNNVKAISQGSGSSQTWEFQNEVKLNETKGNVVAFYPYSAIFQSSKSISIESQSQTDYMYSNVVNNVSCLNSTVSLEMLHIMSVLRVNIKLNTYTGNATLSKIGVVSDGIAKTAKLNLQDGSLSDYTGNDISLSDINDQLTNEYKSFDILVLPRNNTSKLTFSFYVNDKVYPVEVSQRLLQSGKITELNFGLNTPSVEQSEWVTNELLVSSSPTSIAASGGSSTLYCQAKQSRDITKTEAGINTTEIEYRTVDVTDGLVWNSTGFGDLNATTIANPTLSFNNNTTESERVSNITATYDGKTGSVKIIQDKGVKSYGYIFQLEEGNVNNSVSSSSGNLQYKILSNKITYWNDIEELKEIMDFSVSSNVDWITTSKTSLEYKENDSSKFRTGKVTFTQEISGKIIEMTILQRGNTSIGVEN